MKGIWRVQVSLPCLVYRITRTSRWDGCTTPGSGRRALAIPREQEGSSPQGRFSLLGHKAPAFRGCGYGYDTSLNP